MKLVTLDYSYEFIYDKYNLTKIKITNMTNDYDFLDLIIEKNDYNNRGYNISIWKKNQKGNVTNHVGLSKSFIDNASIYDLLNPSGPIILNKDSKSEYIKQVNDGYSFVANIGDKIVDIFFENDDVILAYYPNSNTIFAHKLQVVNSVIKVNRISDYFEKHIIASDCIISEYGCDNAKFRDCRYLGQSDEGFKSVKFENYHYINGYDILPHYIYREYLKMYEDDTNDSIDFIPFSIIYSSSRDTVYCDSSDSLRDIYIDTLFPEFSLKGYKYKVCRCKSNENYLNLEIEIYSE